MRFLKDLKGFMNVKRKYIKENMRMNKTLKWLLGIIEEPKQCVYNYRVKQMKEAGLQMPEKDYKCSICTGIPKDNGCWGYMTLAEVRENDES